MTVKLTTKERRKFWIQGKSCNPQFCSIFQNEYPISDQMIDEELAFIDKTKLEMDEYRKDVEALKERT